MTAEVGYLAANAPTEGNEEGTANRSFWNTEWPAEKVFLLVGGIVAVGFGLFFIITYLMQRPTEVSTS